MTRMLLRVKGTDKRRAQNTNRPLPRKEDGRFDDLGNLLAGVFDETAFRVGIANYRFAILRNRVNKDYRISAYSTFALHYDFVAGFQSGPAHSRSQHRGRGRQLTHPLCDLAALILHSE